MIRRNGESSACFFGLAQGIGIARERDNLTVTPALTLVLGRGERGFSGPDPFAEFIAVVSRSLTYHAAHR